MESRWWWCERILDLNQSIPARPRVQQLQLPPLYISLYKSRVYVVNRFRWSSVMVWVSVDTVYCASGQHKSSSTSSWRSVFQTLLLVTVLKDLFVRWRRMVAIGWRRRVSAHHHVGRAGLWGERWVCHGDTGVSTCHPVDSKSLHDSWLLGNWKRRRRRRVSLLKAVHWIWLFSTVVENNI